MREQDEVVLTGTDWKRFVLGHGSRAVQVSLVLAAVVFVILLMVPPTYKHELTVKVTAQKGSPIGALSLSALGMSESGSSYRLAVLQSQSVLTQVIEELGLQAFCPVDSWWQRRLAAIKERLRWGDKGHSWLDCFVFRDVKFDDDVSFFGFLRLTKAGEYEILSSSGQCMARAKLGSRIEAPWGCLTLDSKPSRAQEGILYPLRLRPLEKEQSYWQKRMRIAFVKESREVVRIRLRSNDRFLGVQMLDALVRVEKQTLKREGEVLRKEHLRFLEEEFNHLAESYYSSSSDYASFVERNLGTVGFAATSQEMASFEKTGALCASKLFEIDLQLRRLALASPLSIGSPSPLEGPLRGDGLFSPLGSAGLSVPVILDALSDSLGQYQKLQVRMQELLLLKRRIQDPCFELLSLSGASGDPLIEEVVKKVLEVSLQQRDSANRSVREQERLGEALAAHRAFLLNYLTETVDLNRRKLEVLKERISSLKAEAEKGLQSERGVVLEKQKALGSSLQGLTERWVREAQQHMQQERVTAVLKGMEQAAASLQLEESHAASAVQVIDPAQIPRRVHPLSLGHLFLTVWVVSFFGVYFFLFLRDLCRGFPVSAKMLRAWNFCAYESLPCAPARLLSFLSSSSLPVVALVGRDALLLGSLLAGRSGKRGYKTLVIACDETAVSSLVPVQREENWDQSTLGGADCIDTLYSRSFAEMLASYRKHYERILVLLPLAPSHPEASHILLIADRLILSVQQERRCELESYLAWARGRQEGSVVFVCS